MRWCIETCQTFKSWANFLLFAQSLIELLVCRLSKSLEFVKSNAGELDIGSSIFVVPAVVLEATGSVGASLLLWFLTPILPICGLFVWLEMGLGVPKFSVLPKDRNGNVRPGPVKEVCTPRNGGEKNYVSLISYNQSKILGLWYIA